MRDGFSGPGVGAIVIVVQASGAGMIFVEAGIARVGVPVVVVQEAVNPVTIKTTDRHVFMEFV
jgi:hypothetical protein